MNLVAFIDTATTERLFKDSAANTRLNHALYLQTVDIESKRQLGELQLNFFANDDLAHEYADIGYGLLTQADSLIFAADRGGTMEVRKRKYEKILRSVDSIRDEYRHFFKEFDDAIFVDYAK